jgi:RNA polymerase sigma factor (sigma-70 family)
MTEEKGGNRLERKNETTRRLPGNGSRRRTALFLRVRDGELYLFGGLVEELDDLLRRRLRFDARTQALGNNPPDVDDVLQETFLRLWEKRDRFDSSRGLIDTWAWAIARNIAVDVLRRQSKTALNTTLLDAVEDRRPAPPESGLMVEETQKAFAEALERVTNPKVRQVLELRLVAGLPYDAVSKATGVPPGTVATWVHRLRRALRAGTLPAA